MKKVMILLIACLSGCASNPMLFNKPDITADQLKIDKAACRMALAQSPIPYQQAPQNMGAGQGFSDLGAVLQQQEDTESFLQNCMEAKGYTRIQ